MKVWRKGRCRKTANLSYKEVSSGGLTEGNASLGLLGKETTCDP